MTETETLLLTGVHKSRIKRIIDGDTVEMDVYLKSEKSILGFGIEYRSSIILRDWKVRFCGINAWEKNQPGGPEAAQYLSDRILKRYVRSEFHLIRDQEKQGKFGRWVATIFYKNSNINLEMIENGHAVEQHY